ncbi:MAG TPA: ATP--guanido phosphotransferase [Elusimicrobia bacterium]|nr:ATP--guanido phosphotransferase [Elusimicrobiota bacterium]
MAEVVNNFRPYVAWANARGAWPDMIFSTRVRFARNLEGFPFPSRAEPRQLAEIRRLALAAARGSGLFSRGHFLKTEALNQLKKRFLVERHHISHALAASVLPSGAAVANDEDLSVMINEEDHLRLQCLNSGFAIEDSFKAALKLDSALGSELPFAYGVKFGFLTACPTNVGTGMRVSCLAHLPALSRLGRMPAVLENLSHLGVTARGIYGEGTYVLGDFYQISNATCLGRSEEEFCQNIDRVIRNLIRQEIAAREEMLKGPLKLKTEDAVYRALGLLKHARRLSYEEFMQNISLARMGAAMGWNIGVDFSTFNQVTLLMQPAHIQAAAGRALNPDERDAFRADYLRGKLG